MALSDLRKTNKRGTTCTKINHEEFKYRTPAKELGAFELWSEMAFITKEKKEPVLMVKCSIEKMEESVKELISSKTLTLKWNMLKFEVGSIIESGALSRDKSLAEKCNSLGITPIEYFSTVAEFLSESLVAEAGGKDSLFDIYNELTEMVTNEENSRKNAAKCFKSKLFSAAGLKGKDKEVKEEPVKEEQVKEEPVKGLKGLKGLKRSIEDIEF